jgi:hypothetical protein
VIIYLFICSLFNDDFTRLTYIASNERVIMERIWKEAVTAYFNLLSLNSPRGTEENHEIPQTR